MTYSPINVAAYTAAFSGAVAGMGVSGWITDQNSTDYTNVTLIAGAFAQAFDQVWNNATQLNNLEQAAITAAVQTDFNGRGPGPFNNPTFQDPSNWTKAAGACAALILESDIFFTNEGINPGIPGSSPTVVYFTPITGGGDDTPRIQVIFDALDLIPGSKTVISLPGVYNYFTSINPRSHIMWKLPPTAINNYTIPFSAFATFSLVFDAAWQFYTVIGTLTVAAAPNVITVTASAVAGLNVGDHIYFNAHQTNSSYQVRAITGNVITLDAPSWQQLPMGTEVRKYQPLDDFHIDGGTWQGQFTGIQQDSRVFFASAAWNCSWENIHNTIIGQGPTWVYGFDFGGRNNLIANCVNHNSPTSKANTCFAYIEGQIGTTIRDCIGYDTGGIDWNRGGNSCFALNNRLYSASHGMTLTNIAEAGGQGVNGLQSNGFYVQLTPGGIGLDLWYRAHDNHFVNTVIVGTDSTVGIAIACREGSIPGDGAYNNTFENLEVIGIASLIVTDYSSTGNVVKNVEVNDVFSLCTQQSATDETRLYNIRGALKDKGFAGYNLSSSGGRIELHDSNIITPGSVAFGKITAANGIVLINNSTVTRTPAYNGFLVQSDQAGGQVRLNSVNASGFENGLSITGGSTLSLSGRYLFDHWVDQLSATAVLNVSPAGGTFKFSDGNRILTLTELQNPVIEILSTSSATIITIPPASGLILTFENDCGHNVQLISTASGDTGVTLATGHSQSVRVTSTMHCVANSAVV